MSQHTPPFQSPADITAVQSQLRVSRMLNIVLVAVAVFLVIVVIAQTPLGKTATVNSAQSPAVKETQAGATETPVEVGEEPYLRRLDSDTMAIGSIDAPVVIAEWTDFRCPFCAVFSNQTLPDLVKEYIDQGLVRVEFNDVSMFGEQSEMAAVAARAAGEQGLYAEYISVLYQAAPDSGHPDLPREKLIDFALTAGVPDIERFTADLESADLIAAVQASTAQASSWGITSVPFFVIDGQSVAGAQPVDTFRQLIDQALAK